MRIDVRDGSELVVIAQVDAPSVQDPLNLIGGIARAFRIVASKRGDGTLELVPIGGPIKVSSDELAQIENRK